MTDRQQVDVWVHLTYDADATLPPDALRVEIQDDIERLLDADSESAVELQMAKVATIREEAVIYGNAEGLPDLLLALKATRTFPWVHNAAITSDIEALRKICLAYSEWNNTILAPLLQAIEGKAVQS